MDGMTQVQVIAFWIWWRSGYNGHGQRSFKIVAEKLKLSQNTVSEWHKKFNWEALAEREDLKTNREIEKEVKREIIQNFQQALDRQRDIISLIYKRFKDLIEDIPVASLKLSDLIKLMEFETNYVWDQDRGQPKGNVLSVVLQMMSPEERTKFNAAIERARDAGVIPVGRLGHPSSN